VLALVIVGIAPVVERLGVIGVEPDGLVVVPNGAVGLALVIVGIAPVVERLGVIGVEPDGLVEVLNGTVGLALTIVGSAPVEEGLGEIRVEPDGLVEVLNGAVGLGPWRKAMGRFRSTPESGCEIDPVERVGFVAKGHKPPLALQKRLAELSSRFPTMNVHVDF
jgi:hypothetical protein